MNLLENICETNKSNWGSFTSLFDCKDFRIKYIRVNHHSRFGYHYHQTVDELFIIRKGSLWVYINGIIKIYSEGEFVNIPRNAKHHLKNNYDGITELIEIQIGLDAISSKDCVRLNIMEIKKLY